MHGVLQRACQDQVRYPQEADHSGEDGAPVQGARVLDAISRLDHSKGIPNINITVTIIAEILINLDVNLAHLMISSCVHEIPYQTHF